jgi:hypothetical protein
MNIDFPDGGPDDVAVLKASIPISSSEPNAENKDPECIYHGNLRDKSDVAVSLNGCPKSDIFEVYSYSNQWLMLYHVYLISFVSLHFLSKMF